MVSAKGVFLRTDRVFYEEESWNQMVGMLVNLSSDALTIEDNSPQVYQLRKFGLGPPLGIEFPLRHSSTGSISGTVGSGTARSLEMDFYHDLVMEPENLEWALLGLTYFVDDREYVVYSNRIAYAGSDVARRSDSLVDALHIGVSLDEPFLVSLTNDASERIWYNSICSDFPSPPSYFGLGITTLERYSDQGTWQVIRPDRRLCERVVSPVPIDPCDQVSISMSDGYPAWKELSPGVYRWNVVYYAEGNLLLPDPPISVYSERHLFTETFRR
jgi:hypothetical protein